MSSSNVILKGSKVNTGSAASMQSGSFVFPKYCTFPGETNCLSYEDHTNLQLNARPSGNNARATNPSSLSANPPVRNYVSNLQNNLTSSPIQNQTTIGISARNPGVRNSRMSAENTNNVISSDASLHSSHHAFDVDHYHTLRIN